MSKTRISIGLESHSIAYLDRLRADIRETTGAVIERQEFLQALVDGLAAKGINAARIHGVPDLRRLLGA